MTSDKKLSGAATHDEAFSSARESLDDARDHASEAGRQAQGLAGQASDMAGDLYGRAREQVQGLSDRLPNSASDAYRAGQQAYAQGSDRVVRQVTKQPIEALLLAGALGYLVGWATSRS